MIQRRQREELVDAGNIQDVEPTIVVCSANRMTERDSELFVGKRGGGCPQRLRIGPPTRPPVGGGVIALGPRNC